MHASSDDNAIYSSPGYYALKHVYYVKAGINVICNIWECSQFFSINYNYILILYILV